MFWDPIRVNTIRFGIFICIYNIVYLYEHEIIMCTKFQLPLKNKYSDQTLNLSTSYLTTIQFVQRVFADIYKYELVCLRSRAELIL